MIFVFPRFLISDSSRGIALKFFSTLFFAIATSCVFYLNRAGTPISPFQIAFFQAVIPLIFISLYERLTSSSSNTTLLPSFLTQDPFNALGRAIFACLGFVAWFWSLKLLPLSLAAFFRLLGPLVTFGAALLFLKERASWVSVTILCGTLLGAEFLMHEELKTSVWTLSHSFDSVEKCLTLSLPFGSVIGFAGANVFAKRLLVTVSPAQATLSLLGLSSIMLSVLAIPVWCWPNATQWAILLFIGGLDALAQLSLSRALSLTKLSLLVPIGLWRFALLALSGMLFFDEPFRPLLWGGVGLIAVMTALIIRRG